MEAHVTESWQCAHSKAMCGSGAIAVLILNIATRWGWMVGCTAYLLLPQGKHPHYLWVGGWVWPIPYLHTWGKRQVSCPSWELNHDSSDVQPVDLSLVQSQNYTLHLTIRWKFWDCTLTCISLGTTMCAHGCASIHKDCLCDLTFFSCQALNFKL